MPHELTDVIVQHLDRIERQAVRIADLERELGETKAALDLLKIDYQGVEERAMKHLANRLEVGSDIEVTEESLAEAWAKFVGAK